MPRHLELGGWEGEVSGLVGTASCQLEKTTPDHVVVTALRMPFTRDVVIVSDDSPLLERAIGGSSPLVGDHMCVVATVICYCECCALRLFVSFGISLLCAALIRILFVSPAA